MFHQYHSKIRVIQDRQLEWRKMMSHSACETIEARIQKIMQDLDTLDNQLRILEVEGMNQLNPWRYFALQPKVDRLIRKKHALQDEWQDAMNELAICRSGQPSPHHP
jgi:predicted  nucleic acid-binding Zn-ribbon protein